jgi:phosphoribosylaminoimidazole-succinocarboxamide synthase
MRHRLPKNVRTHLVEHGGRIFKYLPRQDYPNDLASRSLVIRKLKMIPVEFIFRSRMAGSLWKDYYQKDLPNPYKVELPSGLQLMSPFKWTVFTPTDKSETDDPLSAATTLAKYPEAYQLALRVYQTGQSFAGEGGIEIIDGKFEVGIDEDGEVVLADECLTPDSCRFVRTDSITVGQEPTWLDKQYLREEAERVWAGGKKTPLTFSSAVIDETTRRYEEIVTSLTGTL